MFACCEQRRGRMGEEAAPSTSSPVAGGLRGRRIHAGLSPTGGGVAAALLALCLVHTLSTVVAQELVALAPSQEQEIVDAHNTARLGPAPLPCEPLLTIGWDALLAEAAAAHAMSCQQALQAQSERRTALEQVVAPLGIPITSSVIGQSVSVIVTPANAILPLRATMETAFQVGQQSYNYTANDCVATDGFVSPSVRLQCRQYVDMVTSSVTSVGCAVSRCAAVGFGADAAPLPQPPSSSLYLVNCLYAPITGDFQTPDGIVINQPYRSGCDSSSTGNSTNTGMIPTIQQPTTVTIAMEPTTQPPPPTAVMEPVTATDELPPVAMTTVRRVHQTTLRRIVGQATASPGDSQSEVPCRLRRGKRRRRRSNSDSVDDAGTPGSSNSDSDSDSDSMSSDEDCSQSDSES